MLTIVTISVAGGVMLLIAIFLAAVLGWANRAFHVEVDPKVELIIDELPGANCGGCGFAGCAEYAEAVAEARTEVNLCAPGGVGCALALAEIMGVAAGDVLPYRPVVHCAATITDRLRRRSYRGEPTCASANLVAGIQGCTYGCLGLGDCERVCEYDAIRVIDGLAVVNYEACVGCRACAEACPRNIITMVPFKAAEMFVNTCCNKDKGLAVKEVCNVGCIGCKACARVNPDLLKMQDNLPVFDYEKYDPATDFAAIVDKCKREGFLFVGRPQRRDLAAVADEELPERIEADFKSTVDETEWRG